MPGWPLHVLQMVLALVVVAGPVPLALALVSRNRSDDDRPLEHLLAAGIFTIAAQVAVGLALGLAGLLDVGPLLVLEFLLLLAGIGVLRKSGLPRLVPANPLGQVEAGTLTVLLIAGALGFADLVVHPTRNFDSLAYHLPVMARWISSSSLEVFVELGQVALYPSHWELPSAMLQLPIGQDLLISAPNLLAWSQLGLAVIFLARILGASRAGGMVAAALVLLTPSVLSRLDAIQPDIALAAVFLTALGFAMRRTGRLERLDLLVLLLSIGVLAGLKLSGPVFVLLLLPFVVLGPRLAWQGPAAWRERVLPPTGRTTLIAWTGFAVALALFWYLRNWFAFGNPFGDLQIDIFGSTLFEGSITRAELQRGALSNVFRVGSGEDWSVLGAVLWEWLGAGAAFLLVAAVLAVASSPASRRVRLVVAGLLVACAILYWRTPYSGDNGTHDWRVTGWIEVGLRYGFPVLALLGALGGAGMSRWRRGPALGLAVLVVTSVLTVLEHLIPHVVVLAGVVALAWGVSVGSMGRRVDRRLVLALGAVVAVSVVFGLGLARERREVRRWEGFGVIVDAMAENLDADDVVVVVNSQKLHLAAGLDWKRRVELAELPVAGQEEAWVASLRARGVTAVLVGHQPPPPGTEADVRRVQSFVRESGHFELVRDYESLAKDLALFRVLPQSSR